jgi:pyochelin synthetase
MADSSFALREVQAEYWAGRTRGLTLGNVAAYCYYEYEADGIEVARLNRAWRLLIGRHDALRPVVRPDGLQQVLPEIPVYYVRLNHLRALESTDRDTELTLAPPHHKAACSVSRS